MLTKEKQAEEPQVQIDRGGKEIQGLYSNVAVIFHRAEEFSFDFFYIYPNGTQGKLLGNVVTSPGHAKRIWRALGENIEKYEAQFGETEELPEVRPALSGFVQ